MSNDTLSKLALGFLTAVPVTITAVAGWRKISVRRKLGAVEQIQELQSGTIDRLEKDIRELENFKRECQDDRNEFAKRDTQREIDIIKLQAYYEALQTQFKASDAFHDAKANGASSTISGKMEADVIIKPKGTK